MTDNGRSPGVGGLAQHRLLSGLLLWYLLFWAWMAISPVDWNDWLLENVLAVGCVGLLVWTRHWFQFSNLSYILITIFLTIHAVGARYTYAQVPFGFWLQDLLHAERNPFDRLVHFADGFLRGELPTWERPISAPRETNGTPKKIMAWALLGALVAMCLTIATYRWYRGSAFVLPSHG